MSETTNNEQYHEDEPSTEWLPEGLPEDAEEWTPREIEDEPDED